jgi:hypothetical protein
MDAFLRRWMMCMYVCVCEEGREEVCLRVVWWVEGDLTSRMGRVGQQNSTIQHDTVQHNTVQYNTVQYSTVQYSTVQYSIIQHNTMQQSHALAPQWTRLRS